jgi:integrase
MALRTMSNCEQQDEVIEVDFSKLPSHRKPLKETISVWVEEYIENKDVTQMLTDIRAKYPSLPMQKKILSMMRTSMLLSNKRHSAYSTTFRAWLKDHPDIARDFLSQVKDFTALSLIQQVDVTRAIRTLMARGSATWSGSKELDHFICYELPLAPQYVQDLRMELKDQLSCVRMTEEALVDKHTHCFRLTDATQVIERMRCIINDPKANKNLLAVALLLASGRRMVEVLARCSFIDIPNQSHGTLVTGFVKSRHLNLIEDRVLKIPLLLPYSEFKRALLRLRKQLFGKDTPAEEYPSNEALSNRYASQLNRVLKVWLKRQDVHIHMLRAIYATLCHNLFQPHRFSLMAFISNVLGHTAIGTAAHYSAITCDGVNEGALREGFDAHLVFNRPC